MIDPLNSSTVFVGTGEGNLSGDSFFGNGLYVISNADSFNPVVTGPFNVSAASTDIFTGRSITGIVVSPLDTAGNSTDNVVFCASSSGIGGIVANSNGVSLPRAAYTVPSTLGLTRQPLPGLLPAPAQTRS